MRPLISLVTGTYNRLKLLKAMLNSFRANLPPGMPYEIVVCDGGSTDGTLEYLRSQYDVVLIEDGELKGAISAFTRAAYKAQGKYILISNDDVWFKDDSVLPAIIHLEDNPTCGAVAFADNRPVPPYYTVAHYKVLKMPAIVQGKLDYVVYAQVGLFRKWLGDRVHWWEGEHGEMVGARTYGGDNCLSAHIWGYGYSVDEVSACIVEDTVIEDELRAINREAGKSTNDSNYYYGQWKTEVKGPRVPDKPTIPNLDTRAPRFLYLPIYEPGWQAQKDPVVGKRGLRDALARAKNAKGEQCIVYEFDYMGVPKSELYNQLLTIILQFKPTVILSQIQAAEPLTADMVGELKSRCNAVWINWNGDQAVGGLKSAEMMRIIDYFDLQTMVSKDVSDYYDGMGVKWAYWQIGYEDPQGDLLEQLNDYYRRIGQSNPYIHLPQNTPVVFLASLRSDARRKLAGIIDRAGGRVFVPGDEYGTLYNFVAGKYIYQHARIALSDNEFPDSYGFVSNRLMQILGAGGAILFQQHVHGLDELTGLQAGVHYVEYSTPEELPELFEYWLSHEQERAAMAARALAFVQEYHSFDYRVKELFGFIKTKLGASKQLVDRITLKYIGRNPADQFGLGRGIGTQIEYVHQKGHHLLVHKADLDGLLARYPGEWEIVEQ